MTNNAMTVCGRAGTCVILAVLITGCGGDDDGTQLQGPTLAEEIKRARETTDPKARAVALVKVSTRQRREGDPTGADNTIKTATAACNEIEDTAGRASVYCDIAAELARLDRKDDAASMMVQASKSARAVEDGLKRIEVVTRIASLFAHSLDRKESATNQLNDVTEVAANIDKVEDRVKALSMLANAYNVVGDTEKARTQVVEALTAAREIESVHGRVQQLAACAATLGRLKDEEQSQAAFTEAENLIAEIKEDFSQASAMVDLAIMRAEAGNANAAKTLFDKAYAMAEKVADPSIKGELKNRIERERTRF